MSFSKAATCESQRGFDSYSDSVTLNLSFSLHTQMKCCFHAPLMYAESLFALREKITDASATIDDQLVVRSCLNMGVLSLFLHDQSERCHLTIISQCILSIRIDPDEQEILQHVVCAG